ncbi:methylated-DNA--[protein]-cysteine S-methyltransferase [Cnuibacter physcomitrellae]|uniref:methylated-DNA--[protein]-cysteine S-methyltransferase n=1 Tax=Cnuibacter physcomitrellae TaxID=1619308 RepID=UPI0021759618|nr:methylated-DNA--[protein]-cysteine S-methyltransferase [Cnuibacter physcomitrellae]MCS5498787.1 methylated-DNA--[protein]-cysteine S-methyltransferase [Cnuibacter physcomitrellae]
MTLISQFVDTPDGAFGILSDEDGRVVASGWTDQTDALLIRLSPAARDSAVVAGVTPAASAVEAYYAGEVAAIDAVEVAQRGGPFHLQAWVGLREIAPGRPLTYAQFAAALGRPSAVRAAASACARNAPALFVPCHRVLRTDGTMGGFAWGVPVKRSLLAREAAATRPSSE